MSGGLHVERIVTAEALAQLEPAWWRLWRAIPDASPFTSPAWLLSWWQVFAPGELRTIAIWRGGDLVALAPLYLERGVYGLRLLPLGIGISDGFDVLLHPGHGQTCSGDPDRTDATAGVDESPAVAGVPPAATMIGVAGSSPAMTGEGWDVARALADALAAEPDWECLPLEELPAAATALSLPCLPGCTDEMVEQSASPLLAFATDPLHGIPARKRRKLRMAQNRVARRGGAVRAVGPNQLDTFLAELSRLHGARWTSRGEDGVLVDDAVQRFHAAALPRLVAAGLARLYTLTIEGKVAGAYYGLLHGGVAYAYIGGFDPAFAFESPGTVLLGHAIEDAAAAGATAFDFLRGQEPYKYEWGAVDRWSRRRAFRRSA
jgi:CelD/BcsL family acetyltransferase involved in cellulose biosynthesis